MLVVDDDALSLVYYVNITDSYDFSRLEVRPTNNNPRLYYFYDTLDRQLVAGFILTDQPTVQRVVTVTLVKDRDNFLSPRFCFSIRDKKKMKIIPDPISLEEHFVKASVDLDSNDFKGSKVFWKLVGFLTSIRDIHLEDFAAYSIARSDDQLKHLLIQYDHESLMNILSQIDLSSRLSKDDINTVLQRKKSLLLFKKLLEQVGYWKEYLSEQNEKNDKHEAGEEKAWQYFFQENDWVFGYGLDYRFMTIFDRECVVSSTGTDNQNKSTTDFLNTFSDFTVLVEIKTPSTPLFEDSKQRAGCWKLSEDLIDSVSQCLEQKASWTIEGDQTDKHYNKQGDQKLNTRTRDPKQILLVGNKQDQIQSINSIRDMELKQDTFELFRRDSRNIEILTFDELYERAKFIVEGNK